MRRLATLAAGAMLLACAGCRAPPVTATVAVPALPPQLARIWFYRDPNIYDGPTTPYVRLNDAVIAAAAPGTAFYRDVPPGRYLITVDSLRPAFDRGQIVDIAEGRELFAKVMSLGGPAVQGGLQGSGFHRDTFYLWFYAPEAARAQIAQSYFSGGTSAAAAPPR